MKIFVVSRAVVERMHTPKLLNVAKVPFTLVVDSKEQAKIARENGCFDVVVSPMANLVDKRNWITQLSKNRGDKWYIGMDDNIQQFTKVSNPYFNNHYNQTNDGTNWRPRYNEPCCADIFVGSLEALAKLADKVGAPYGGVATMENPFFRAKRVSFRRFVKSKVFIMNPRADIEFKHPMCHDSYATAQAIAKFGKVVVDNYLFYKSNWYEKGGIGDRKRREELGLLDQLDSIVSEFPGLVARAKGQNSALRICKVIDSSVNQWRREHGYL